jgi:outer membrane protein assembly factor BamB
MSMRRLLLSSVTLFVMLGVGVDAQQWPSFRGPAASGVAPEARPPVAWNVRGATNVAWRVDVPGLGHSSPIVWGDRIYLTTAVSDAPGARALVLGDSDAAGIDPANDRGIYQWQVLALDRQSGRTIWARTVHQGAPRVKRHVKGSQASATPATDGRIVVAMLGSEALVALDVNGTELWRKDLGVLAVGLADDPTYEWGPASSPVIHGSTVIVQNDRYKDSYLIAFDLQTGKERWRSPRDELPAWATPLVHAATTPETVVTSSPRFIRGHDFRTGRERWRIADPEGQVKVSTPVAAGALAIVTGGWPSAARPILAVRVADGSIAWRHERGSPYTSTPLVVDGLLYVLTDNGILSAYQAADGVRVYQQRVSREAGSFSASPIAAGGNLYLTSEDGKVFVVRAGRTFELLAINDMDEPCMATPAPSGDLLIVRTAAHLYALGGSRGGPGSN